MGSALGIPKTESPARPPVKNTGWPRNEIDFHVLARLEREGLNPSSEASRETLIRRLCLDLTGLPPKTEEVDAFVADKSPDAYEKLVDRLLSSSHYGERMAWDWLDAARYADSNGYQGDNERTMWPWRDWVVKAFNENLPFDQFTVWQLAGDLLPNPSQDKTLATGFLRNHMINGEGGRIAEENRSRIRVGSGRNDGHGLAGSHVQLLPLPRPQIRSAYAARLLRAFAFFNQTPVDGGGGIRKRNRSLRFPLPNRSKRRKSLKSSQGGPHRSWTISNGRNFPVRKGSP